MTMVRHTSALAGSGKANKVLPVRCVVGNLFTVMQALGRRLPPSLGHTHRGSGPKLAERLLAPRRLQVLRTCASNRPQRSFDSEDELDRVPTEEFQAIADPAKFQRLSQHLELLWSVSERKRPEQCESCSGTGEKECDWCHGTGVMTVGDNLFCDHNGCKPCPVCRGMGQCKCEHCRGTGRRAGWMGKGRSTPH